MHTTYWKVQNVEVRMRLLSLMLFTWCTTLATRLLFAICEMGYTRLPCFSQSCEVCVGLHGVTNCSDALSFFKVRKNTLESGWNNDHAFPRLLNSTSNSLISFYSELKVGHLSIFAPAVLWFFICLPLFFVLSLMVNISPSFPSCNSPLKPSTLAFLPLTLVVIFLSKFFWWQVMSICYCVSSLWNWTLPFSNSPTVDHARSHKRNLSTVFSEHSKFPLEIQVRPLQRYFCLK